jgi:hypothetical protein
MIDRILYTRKSGESDNLNNARYRCIFANIVFMDWSMNRFLPASFRRIALRPVAVLLIVAQANVLAQELPTPPADDMLRALRERPLEQTVRDALPAIEQAPARADEVEREDASTLSANSYAAFAREFEEAKVPYCLHHDGLKRQPTGIGPFVIGGYLALPFIFVARARAKCLF